MGNQYKYLIKLTKNFCKMEGKITDQLNQIEKEHNVKIIYACESGSRAWGYPSLDSDYDVRFVYVHHKDWYLSIADKKDVIELPIDESLDINGWDIRKSLSLLRRSNAPLLEWLSSPIIYKSIDSVMDDVRSLAQKAFLPEPSYHHYLSMAKKYIINIQESERVKYKSYLYALRPLLCCKWIIVKRTQPPMRIQDLIAAILNIDELKTLREYIAHLILEKGKGCETSSLERSYLLDSYLFSEFASLSANAPKNSGKVSVKEFDSVFVGIVNELSG